MFELARASAHGIVQGAAAELGGGEFRDGFLGGSVGSFGGHLLEGSVGSTMLGDINMNEVIAAAVVGGTAAEIGGGKFANGAYSAAFSSLVNQQAQANRQSEADQEVEGSNRTGFATPDEAGIAASIEALAMTRSDPVSEYVGKVYSYMDDSTGTTLYGYTTPMRGVSPSNPIDGVVYYVGGTDRVLIPEGATYVAGFHSHLTSNDFSGVKMYHGQRSGDKWWVMNRGKPMYLGRFSQGFFDSSDVTVVRVMRPTDQMDNGLWKTKTETLGKY